MNSKENEFSMRKRRGEGADAKRVSSRLENFNQNESIAYQTIIKKFSLGITHKELKRIAEILAINNSLHLDRDAKRDNRVLIKWFDEHWRILSTEIEKIHAYDENGNLIIFDEENNK